VTHTDATDAARVMVDHLFRNRAGQMVAYLTRIFGPSHLELAEEVVQDSLLKALQQWPFSGIPENPGGWLFRVARNGALDALRRHASFRDKAAALAHELASTAHDAVDESTLEDDELGMMFMCCHPSLPRDARVALSLKTVGGFSVPEIARAFLAAEPAIAQRLVRAKRQIREMDLDLELPDADGFGGRLESVLEVIYLLFNEGYGARSGDDLIRLDLCGEALRLGRLVADSPATSAPAAHALVALMAFQAARLPARVDARGELVLLEDQDRSLWDARLIALGFRHLGQSAEGPVKSAYHVQAAIAAIHAGTSNPAATPWDRILELYDELRAMNASPVVALNRAVALSKTVGPAAALAAITPLEAEPALAGYYLLPSVKARFLADIGDHHGAAAAYRDALERPCTEPERRFIVRRLGEIERTEGTETFSTTEATE
jgi:RNA polymerase sigma-70 factor (ECF subfamily)